MDSKKLKITKNNINLNDMFLGNSNKKTIDYTKNIGNMDSPNSIRQKPRIINNINNFDNKNSHTKLNMNSKFINKPSDKFHKKSSDPFESGNKKKSNFVYVYQAGGIPCKLVHGSVRLKLNWDISPDSKIKNFKYFNYILKI